MRLALCSLLSLATLAGCTCDGAPEPSVQTRPEARNRTPAPEVPKRSWDPKAPDITSLAQIWNGGAEPTEQTPGEKITISHYDARGWKLVRVSVYKDNPNARRLTAEGGHCSPHIFAPSVTLLEDRGDEPHKEQWYQLSGGPFSGLTVKAFVKRKEGECMYHVATPEYAAETQWRYPKQPAP